MRRWALSARRAIRSLGRDLLDAAFDRRCPGCGGTVPRDLSVCTACDAAVPRTGAGLCLRCLRGDAPTEGPAGACPRHGSARLLLAGPPFEPPLNRILHAFKYEGATRLAPWIASLVPEPPDREGPFGREAALVPVPLHAARRAERGFDQTALLAGLLARRWGIPAVGALRRSLDTIPQARLDPGARRRNLAGAFEVVEPALLRGRPVLLLDDVATTGSTLLAAADAVARAGPALIVSLSAARGGHPEDPSRVVEAEVATRALHLV
ncbi:MAG TPA: phosphoribosyltransferase family protein [Candidatus Eisenbacteria bacterium]